MKVYPRAGGGTTTLGFGTAPDWGLSPRRRGNRLVLRGDAEPDGSIPAQAGEPLAEEIEERDLRVYPRAGGGTDALDAGPAMPTDGSIPAQAGEPARHPRARRSGWVYPRAGGGTAEAVVGPGDFRARRHSTGRSIPAQAGEPLLDRGRGSIPAQAACIAASRVYPRAGGGTIRPASAVLHGRRGSRGLSPRRRGNRGPEPRRRDAGRSRWHGTMMRVYPRAGGGTVDEAAHPRTQDCVSNRGLSPRRRGNPRAAAASIPAHRVAGLSPRRRGNRR